MQYIQGKIVRDLENLRLIKACNEIGKIIGVLHKNGIMHGDLTTSNFILNKGKVFSIDFGLSQRTPRLEDHAVDLRLFKEILGSEHVELMEKLWLKFLQGYKSVMGTDRFNKVLNHVSIIEGRGRYATVV
jgi:TP53 regulating kinase-like protein